MLSEEVLILKSSGLSCIGAEDMARFSLEGRLSIFRWALGVGLGEKEHTAGMQRVYRAGARWRTDN